MISKEKEILENRKIKLGIAAGLDKNGDYIDCLASLRYRFY